MPIMPTRLGTGSGRVNESGGSDLRASRRRVQRIICPTNHSASGTETLLGFGRDFNGGGAHVADFPGRGADHVAVFAVDRHGRGDLEADLLDLSLLQPELHRALGILGFRR
ncbi:MAG: hypothetical protein ACK56F_32040, partial [bacterium]